MCLAFVIFTLEVKWEHGPRAIEAHVGGNLLAVLVGRYSGSMDSDQISDFLAHRQVFEPVCEENDRDVVDDASVVHS